MAEKTRTKKSAKKPKKVDVPGLVIKELTPKHNKEFNEGLSRYAEMVLRKQAGEAITDLYKVPVLKIKGISEKRNAKINKDFDRELNAALAQASSVAVAPIVLGILAGVVGNIVGGVINDIIQGKCAD
jgi:hypothetical protein